MIYFSVQQSLSFILTAPTEQLFAVPVAACGEITFQNINESLCQNLCTVNDTIFVHNKQFMF